MSVFRQMDLNFNNSMTWDTHIEPINSIQSDDPRPSQLNPLNNHIITSLPLQASDNSDMSSCDQSNQFILRTIHGSPCFENMSGGLDKSMNTISTHGPTHEQLLQPKSETNSIYSLSSEDSTSPLIPQAYTQRGDTKSRTAIVRRSRMGCLTCRSRKKRCCENRPKCHECARLGLNCTWPIPGSENRNKPRTTREVEGLHYDAFYGYIKILRGIVESKISMDREEIG